MAAMDPTRKLAEVRLEGAHATPLGTPGDAWPGIERTLDQAAVALANEMVGGAQALFDETLEYVQMRVQFGRAIASFQAIKHRCADMLLDVELAKSAAYAAAEAEAEEAPNWPALASLAKATASDAYIATAADRHPAARRHRVHVGERHASVVQTRQKLRGAPRFRRLSPRSHDRTVGRLMAETEQSVREAVGAWLDEHWDPDAFARRVAQHARRLRMGTAELAQTLAWARPCTRAWRRS